ncbi:ABC transporter ATP-binding protein [Paeniglutamicibacter psychrophenolicus]|uniref:NitT/TauT family transport system ATP-binding protein n=1 Tax=Paeniglutamicibacter psychrophenolicus TaxID=257454 RepID=A0ABS4W8P8_9MICC|nr:ABC transporter ATP-binding protein [Paeniglutamicibacter psychrophenolicus]MBP2372498.1 NitT/TauT family transport system ATP-binding protein [Paeniglutamicibacter psychrophenolicus]
MTEKTAQSSTARGVSVEFENVNHSFLHGNRPVRVLDNFNLKIEPSEFVSIVGPSGCGKTTALGMVGNLLKPRAGKVLIDGHEVRPGSNDAAFLFARDALLPWRRVRSNVELGMEIRGVPKEERRVRAEEWLRKVRLHEFADSDVLHLSQGMRQRVAIARTLVQNPKVLLMDEPFAALDAQTRAIQQEEFTSLWEAERPTVIFVTHDLEEAILLSDRVILMASRPGRMVVDMKIELERPRRQEMRRDSDMFKSYFHEMSDRLRKEVDLAEERIREESKND